jgi:hypothetical protein
MQVSRETLQDFKFLLEDSAEYFCDENMISGELFWTMVECYATAKIAELEGEVLPDMV